MADIAAHSAVDGSEARSAGAGIVCVCVGDLTRTFLPSASYDVFTIIYVNAVRT